MTKIALGRSGNHTIWIDLDVLLKTRALVEGNSGCGKSETLQYLAEQFDDKVQVIILDREGEFSILRKKHNYLLVGKGGDTPADCRSAGILAHKLLELGASAVCDLYEMKDSERHRWVRLFLEALIDAPKHLWHPVIIIIDEIHTFCPEKGSGESEASDAVIDLATRGRKRGFCLIGATQRLGKFRKDAAAELLNIIVGMTFIDIDRKRAAEALGIPKSEERKFFDEIKVMDAGKFWVLGRAISKDRVLVNVNRIGTPRVKAGSKKYTAEPPPPPSSIRALLPKLADLPKAAEEKAKTEADLRQEIRALKAQVAGALRGKGIMDGVKKAMVAPVTKEIIKKIEVPVIKPKDILRIERAMSAAVLAAGKVQDAGVTLRGFSDKVGQQLTKIEQAQRGSLIAPLSHREQAAGVFSAGRHKMNLPTEADRIVERSPVPRALVKAVISKDEYWVSPKQHKILSALAEFAAIGRTSVPRKWVAARSGSSHRSSAFANNLSDLKTKGLIEYGVGAVILLTDDGHRLVGTTPELTADKMKESCVKLLTPKQRLIFEALYHVYPEISSREDLAVAAESSPSSSAYANNLSSLRSADMIEKRRDGTEKLSDWVMLVERVAQGA